MAEISSDPPSLSYTDQYKVIFRDPESILKKTLENGLTVIGFKSEPFLRVGENYGSTMMKITMTLKRETEAEVIYLHLVGKMPPSSEYYRQLFETNYSFQKEIFFYEQLIPTYQDIYKKEFKLAPKYYGSRTSLQMNSDEFDENAAILLENLKVKNYYVVDRHKGLDLEHLKFVIPIVAEFHAIGLALKHKKSSFIPILKKFTRRLAVSNFGQRDFIRKLVNEIQDHPEINQYYDRIKAFYDNRVFDKTLELEEPWACVVHLDFWSNNILFHRDDAGKIEDVKFIDYQTYTVSSPLTDLIFLLCSSMQYPLEHFDSMIELYRESVYNILKELGSDANLFTKEQFEERLKIDAVSEICHLILMTRVVERREQDDFLNGLANEFQIRRLKRIFEIFEQKKWF